MEFTKKQVDITSYFKITMYYFLYIYEKLYFMAKSNFYNGGFDQGTQSKLTFFNEYFKEAFPVFLHSPYLDGIYICDFFAGAGMDCNGMYGTPLLTLDGIKGYCRQRSQKINKRVEIVFNDLFEKDTLQYNVTAFVEACKHENGCTHCMAFDNIIVEQKDFSNHFPEIIQHLRGEKYRKYGKIIFIDPFNLAFNKSVFIQLSNFKRLDFIGFIPSSYLRRFEQFQRNFEVTTDEIKGAQPEHIHKVVAESFERLIPPDKEYYVAHFSIAKGTNKYGIIFGSNHAYGAEKFLKICWALDKETGQADYDIDREPTKAGMLSLFEEYSIPLKLIKFRDDLKMKILKGELKTDYEIYCFTLKRKCLPLHANEALKELVAEGRIHKITLKSDCHKFSKIEDQTEVKLR